MKTEEATLTRMIEASLRVAEHLEKQAAQHRDAASNMTQQLVDRRNETHVDTDG